MKARYINPFTDYGFKKLFGEEASKKLLISFLNDLLPIKDKIINLTFKKNEQQGDIVISRKAVYDIFCEDEKGNQFIVEMQNAKQLYFKDRAIYYSTFPIRDQAQKGDWDFKLEAVYCVGLLGFEFEKENAEKEYINNVQLKNQNNKIFYEKLTFIFIELPKYNKQENELETHFDKWLYFLKNLESFDKIPDILKEEIFEEAFKVAEIANFTQEEILEYEESLKIYRDNINVIETAKEEGREEGREEGKEQGAILARKEDILDNLKDIDTIPEDIIAIIDNQNDIEILKRWSKISARVDSLGDFKEKIKS
jgi:predicted transposase/invertase (TIGR01784 family)